MIIAYIGIGSNINPKENIEKCIDLIKSNFIISGISKFYETKPYGYKKQRNFINLVVKIKTDLNPNELLIKLQSIEKKLGRKRTIKNGPRTIDLDILLYGSKTVNEKNLIIPHKGLLERDFMLIPLLDVDGDILYPGTKKKLKYLKRGIKYHQILREIEQDKFDEK